MRWFAVAALALHHGSLVAGTDNVSELTAKFAEQTQSLEKMMLAIGEVNTQLTSAQEDLATAKAQAKKEREEAAASAAELSALHDAERSDSQASLARTQREAAACEAREALATSKGSEAAASAAALLKELAELKEAGTAAEARAAAEVRTLLACLLLC